MSLLYIYIYTTGGASSHSGANGHTNPAHSTTKFQYLDKNYSFETPSCLIPPVNEFFKSICERYDVAITNREKVDEALQLFKKVLEVDLSLPIADCFSAWKSQLTGPKFAVTRTNGDSGDVRKISVRAEEVPRLKRKAQKHVRDLLDACHLFLQQKEFLKKEIQRNIDQLEQLTRDVPALCKGLNLSSSEKKQMPQVVRRARDQFAQFPDTLDRFWDQVSALLREINESVHVLDDTECS